VSNADRLPSLIDTEAAADVDVFDWETNVVKLAVEPVCLLDGLFAVRMPAPASRVKRISLNRAPGFTTLAFDRGEQFDRA